MVGITTTTVVAHESNHVSGGGDEIDSALALTAIPEHGAAKHTNITRIANFRNAFDVALIGTATLDYTYTFGAVKLDGANEAFETHFLVPKDYHSSAAIKIMFIKAGATNPIVAKKADWGADGEAFNTHSRVASNITLSATAGSYLTEDDLELDFSSHPLAADDIVRVHVQFNTTPVFILGIWFEYTADE